MDADEAKAYTEDEIESERQKNYELGIVEATSRIAVRFNEASGRLFAAEDDVAACDLRQRAKELNDEANWLRDEYQKKWNCK